MDGGSTGKDIAWQRLRASFGTAATLSSATGLAPTRGRAVRPGRKPPGGLRRFVPVAVLGFINAGRGDSSDPLALGSVPVDLEALHIKRGRETFALQVRGESMVGAQISHGDLVILEKREPRVGDIVAALIDGETTLKRLVEHEGQLILRAENPAFPDLVPLQGLSVQGVVRAVVRAYGSPLSR